METYLKTHPSETEWMSNLSSNHGQDSNPCVLVLGSQGSQSARGSIVPRDGQGWSRCGLQRCGAAITLAHRAISVRQSRPFFLPPHVVPARFSATNWFSHNKIGLKPQNSANTTFSKQYDYSDGLSSSANSGSSANSANSGNSGSTGNGECWR